MRFRSLIAALARRTTLLALVLGACGGEGTTANSGSDESGAQTGGEQAAGGHSDSGESGAGGSSPTGGSAAGGSSAIGGNAVGGSEAPSTGGAEDGNGGSVANNVGGTSGSGGELIGSGGESDGDGSGGESDSPTTDVFGHAIVFPTKEGGLEWDSSYWEGDAHELTVGGNDFDPLDPLMLANQRGTGQVTVNGNGTLTMVGGEPRIYLGTIDNHPWLNVEITVYYRRIEDAGTAWGGLVVGARSGPDGHGTDNCTATTYYARFRHDGNADIEKELEHPASEARESIELWEGSPLPTGSWIGMKFVVANVNNDENVRLRVYRDLTEGENGGTWEPLIDSTDDGGWAPDHACSYADDLIIVQGGGVVFIRNTDVEGEGALYQWLTVREIDPQ
jgi:hypothetical protein